MPTLYVRLAILALIVTGGFLCGWWVNGWRHDAIALARMESDQRAIQAAVEQAKKIAALQDERIETAALLDIERNKKSRVEKEIVTNEVIRYVQTPASRSCGLDSDGVCITDKAAGYRVPANPEATSAPNDCPAGVTAARVVQVVSANYGRCTDTRNQLLALQEWVRALE